MRKQKGFLLVVAVFIIILMGFIGVSLTLMVAGSVNATKNFNFADQAYYLSLTGLEIASHNLGQETVTCTAISGGANYTNVSLFGGTFTVTGTSTNLTTTLSAALTSSATSLTVASATGLSASGSVTIDNEQIQYGSITTNTLNNAVRGANGTVAAAHASGALVSQSGCSLSSSGGIPSVASPMALRKLTAFVASSPFGIQLGSSTKTPSMVVGGSVSLANTATIQNASATATSSNFAGSNIISGGPAVLNNSAITQVNSSSGVVTSSSSSGLQGDVMTNNSSINLSTIWGLFFSQSKATVQAAADKTYTSSNLNGAVGKTIWMNSYLNLSGSEVVGSPSNPVILIINENANLGGTATIYGFVYITGSLSTNNTPVINGALVVEGAVNLNGGPKVNYNSAILAKLNLLNSSTGNGYDSTLYNLGETF